MKYSKELHERVRQNLRMFDYPRFDDGDIDALLDEIERLQMAISRLKEDAERLAKMHIIKYFDDAFECDICGHGYSKSPELIVHKPDCPITLYRALMKELEK